MNSKFVNTTKIPSGSGVYFFYGLPADRQGPNRKILYIGKAINLKARINSHFQTDPLHPAKRQMLEKLNAVKWQTTQSEIEALILEARLIKKYKPFYNIALRDDKNYFFVYKTKDACPRLFITHQPTKIRNSKSEIRNKLKNKNRKVSDLALRASDFSYIGPFTEGAPLKSVLAYLRRAFPYCTCTQMHLRKCVNAEIGKCLDFCCNKNAASNVDEKKEYLKNIKNIWTVLSGRKKSLISSLNKEMKIKAGALDFESAAKIRSQIVALERIFQHRPVLENQKVEEGAFQNLLGKIKKLLGMAAVPFRVEAYDISNIQGKSTTGSMVVFEAGKPNKNEYRKFKIKSGESPDDYLMMQEIVRRRLKNSWPLPDLFVLDGGRGQLNSALEVIRKFGLKTPVVALAKREEELYLADKSAPIALKGQDPEILFFFQQIRNEAHRFARNYHKKLRKKKVLETE